MPAFVTADEGRGGLRSPAVGLVFVHRRGRAQHRVDEALLCFETIITRNDQYALAHYNRACVYALRSDADEAAKSLAQAIALDLRFVDEASKDADFDTIRQAPALAALLLIPESDS